MPAYNEEATVAAVLEGVYPLVDELVVVDDGSTDRTAHEIEAWRAGRDRASVITLPRNRGVSAAYRAALSGLSRRLSAGELDRDDLVLTIDADGQHDLAAIDRLCEITEHESLDAMVACRDLSYQRRFKRWGNRLLSLWASVWAGRRLRDAECGYRVLRLGPLTDAMRHLRGFRYSFPAQLTIVMSRLGYRLRNDVMVRVPTSRSRTRISNGAAHFVAIPWSALRVAVSRLSPAPTRARRLFTLGAAALAAGALIEIVDRSGALRGVLAVVLAVSGFGFARRREPGPFVRGAAMLLAPAELWLAGVLWGASLLAGLAAVGTGFTAGLVLARAPTGEPVQPGRRRGRALVIGTVAMWCSAIVWSGANDPAAAWFGRTQAHGARSADMVALTFDDGPNDSTTLALAELLTSRGARGTFFMVGSAVEARPELARALMATGQVIGNHSFRHGKDDWLAPSYPELRRGEQAFATVLGQCPVFFRPPFGRHTPMMAHKVHRMGMHMVTWDVSGHDWDSTDPVKIARRVLSHVKPGSIVLLHDGSAGHPTVDRSVVLAAVGLILDGLDARSLRAVGLDELLGEPAWLPTCPGA